MKIFCLLSLTASLAGSPEEWPASDTTAVSPVTAFAFQDAYRPGESPTEEEFYGYFMTHYDDDALSGGNLSRSLSFVRYRKRGYDNRYNDIRIGDLPAADIADGSVYWNMVSAIRSANGMEETRITSALSSGSYRGRLTAGTRIRSKDESFYAKLFVNYRFGENHYMEGLKTGLVSLALTAGKRFGNHGISLTYAGNFGVQDVRSAVTQEVYELADDHYYNPNGGIQNGDVRNSRQREYLQNFVSLGHSIKFDEQWGLNTEASLFFGRNSYGLLSWYDAPTPYPDYYRYLPGFFGNPVISGNLTEAWAANDPTVTGINWGGLYEANVLNRDQAGESRSHYVVRDLVSDKLNFSFSTEAEYKFSKSLTFKGGAEYSRHSSSNYARLADLLGGDYWIDIDQYLLDDEYYGDMIQNDVRNPGRKVREGDRFGYDYKITAANYRVKVASEYTSRLWRAFLDIKVGRTTYTREGNYEKEAFPGNLSYGKSKPVEFREYSAKASLTYYLTMRQSVSAGFTASNHAPLARHLFISPEYRNAAVPNIRTVKMTGAEAGYGYVSPGLSFSAALYFTRFKDDTYIANYYDDLISEYSNLIMSGIDKVHTGLEVYATAPLTPSLTAAAEVEMNIFKYDSDPAVTIYRDKDGQPILTDSKSYLSGYHLTGMPQRAATVRLAYRFQKRWNMSLSGNYAGGNYVGLNPVRRMTRVMDLAASPEILDEIVTQDRFNDFVTADITLSKDIYLSNGARVGFWLSVANVLDNREIKYGGYEQMRFARTSADSGRLLIPFKPKFYYAYGRTLYFLISYTF